MKRIIIAAVLGVSTGSLLFGQAPQKDTSNRSIDSASVRPRPAIMQADTISRNSKDSVAVGKDTTMQESPKQKLTPPEPKSPTPKNTSFDPNGYKDVQWGMTFRDVHDYLVDHDNVDESEIQPITNGFEYPGTVAAAKAILSYQFDNDRLFIVRVAPKVKATSRFDFLDSFEEYQTTLEAKYGNPTRTGFHKIDEQYLNTIESIQLGFAKKYALWEFERTYIVLVLAGHDKRLNIHITYVSRAIFDEMKDRIETLKLEDF
jgi:hypothetical protein